MLNQTFRSSILLFVSCTTLLIAFSCSDHDWRGPHSNTDRISYRLIADAQPLSRTDGLTGCDILALVDKSGRDTLYLHPNIGNMPAPTEKAMSGSRGTPVATNNFKEVVGSFGVQAYTTGGQLYIANSQVGNYDSEFGIWTETNGAHYWSDEALDFYATAPYNAVAPDYSDIKNKKVTFDYTVPTSADKTTDANVQPDIMMAFTGNVSKNNTVNKSGTVTTKFWHALAGVQFEVGDIAGGTIKSISISGIYGAGKATFDANKIPAYELEDDVDNNTQDNDTDKIPFTWQVTGEANCSYTQTFNAKVNDQLTGNQPVTGSPDKNAPDADLSTTFMLMPQMLPADAEITIVINTIPPGEKTARDVSLTAKINTNGTEEWKAGKIYNYIISTSSINWTYVFEITPTTNTTAEAVNHKPGERDTYFDYEKDTLFHGHRVTHMEYSVVSYRYRTNNPSVKEKLPWRATEYTDATNSIPWRKASVEFSEWLSDLNGKKGLSGPGNFEDEIATYTFRTRMIDVSLVTNCPGDEELYDAAFKGLPGNGSQDDYHPGDQSDDADVAAWDLSMHNVQGTATKQNTANCYIVQGPGRYKLPLVYGNAIKSGTTNTSAFTYQGSGTAYQHDDALQVFVRHSGYTNKYPKIQPNISTNTWPDVKGSLIWTDAYRLVENVHLDAAKEYLVFEVNKEFIQQGNAVVALVQGNGVVIWSWHIWVTNYDLFRQSIKLGDAYATDKNAIRYEAAPVNLGWCDPKSEWFTGRHGHITFQQDKNPYPPVTLNIKQLTATYESSYGNNTCYQFGRKDPFVGVMDHKKDLKHLFYTDLYNTPAKDYTFQIKNNRTNIKNGIRNPHIMYVGGFKHTSAGGDWNNGQKGSPDNKNSNAGSFHPYRNLWNNYRLPANNNATTKRNRVIKTIYDPCPVGWVTPPRDIFRIFLNSSTKTEIEGESLSNYNIKYDGDYKYTVQGTPDKTNPLVFEATGQRWYSLSGIISDTGPGDNWAHYDVYLWTCDSYVEEEHDAVTGETWNIAGGSREISNSFHLIGPKRDGSATAATDSEDYKLWKYGACQTQFAGASAMARPIRPVRENGSTGVTP